MQTENTKHYKPFPELVKDLEGKWPYVFEDLAPELAEAIASAPNHVSCPIHGGSDGFRLFEDFVKTGGGVCNTCGPRPSGFSMLAWVRGYEIKDAVREIARWLDGEAATPTLATRKPVVIAPKVIDTAKNYKRIRETWIATTPLAGTAAERYLTKRGIWKENMPRTLRAHEGLSYYHLKEKKYYGRFPCLVAPIRDKDDNVVSLHRIFLTDEGAKAPVPDAKKMMSPCGELRGAAIKLFPATGDVLGVAEGIETALAVHAISRMPVWSCVSATLMELVDIPEHVKKVVIWADLDNSKRGLEAAEKLAQRLEEQGKVVEIYLPQGPIPEGEKGVDWLDVMQTQGLNGFPAKWRRWRASQAKAA